MSENYYKLSGPLLLLAGPGTGKTYNLAKRIKYLVENKNVQPNNITVITFTAAAARNMQDRISDHSITDLYIPNEKQPKMICTMHSLGNRIIMEKSSDLGFKETLQVINSDRLQKLIFEDAAQLVEFNRSDGMEAQKCRQYGECNRTDEKKCKICKKYEEILRSCSAIDYNDQILLACTLLKQDALLLEKYQSYCKNLLVDEYQDINVAQFELIRLLTKGQGNGLFVVGDDDQSIYSWRGGSPRFIRKFTEYFGQGAQVKPLQKSFRCHPNLLKGAVSIVFKIR